MLIRETVALQAGAHIAVRQRHKLAQHAPHVFQVALQGDAVARECIAWAGRELAALALCVIRQLQQLEFDVVQIGSLHKGGALLTDAMRAALAPEAPGARLVPLNSPPATGGVLLALRATDAAHGCIYWPAMMPGAEFVLPTAHILPNIGVIGMKMLRGAKMNDMRLLEKDGHTYSQAAFKWALASGCVDATVISMTSVETIDEYLGDSGQRQVTAYDFDLLEQYVRLTDLTYCRHACNDCQGACPYGVPIADMLRTRMYATDYGDLTFARSEYAQLGDPVNACLSCDGKPGQVACTHGIQIVRWCGPTHVMLS